MDKLSDGELDRMYIRCYDRVPVGLRVRHKTSGETHMVVYIALREEDLMPLVVYRKTVASLAVWARPMDEFVEKFTMTEKQTVRVHNRF